MVKGLDKFKEYFKDHLGNYIVIGGTACSEHFEQAEGGFRVTKDIDVVIIVETIDVHFTEKFWEFIKDAKYKINEINSVKKYYRFLKPANSDYPYMIELFSRKPDAIEHKANIRFTPIPIDEDISSLSAILLDDNYYFLIIKNSIKDSNFHFAQVETLICLKAKAYLDLKERKEKGESIDEENVNKHMLDVFRLASLLIIDKPFKISDKIKNDLTAFMNLMKTESPDSNSLSQSMKQKVNVEELMNLINMKFEL